MVWLAPGVVAYAVVGLVGLFVLALCRSASWAADENERGEIAERL
jgi:hypothetical protein